MEYREKATILAARTGCTTSSWSESFHWEKGVCVLAISSFPLMFYNKKKVQEIYIYIGNIFKAEPATQEQQQSVPVYVEVDTLW